MFAVDDRVFYIFLVSQWLRSKVIMNFKRISSVVFSLICLSGFLIQVQQVSELYFRFGTTSKTVFQIREVGYYQTMMYCPRSIDLLNITKKIWETHIT